ncbi:MAG: hypothetical protein MN733_23230 [Nitrososphaera sp.]|nr:hypothetical protein [Nitrososphaera sp.]
MGQEFQDAIGTDEWDVMPTAHTISRLGLYHVHRTSHDTTRMLFLVIETTKSCRVCGAKVPDFIWFRYKTWKLRQLIQ